MLKKIFLKNHASYGENGSSLETDKEINLIYGLNGSGKTTITNYLSNQESEDFKDCKIDFSKINPPEINVYNQNFIEINFKEGEGYLKGVFSLSEDSVINKEKIKKINEERNELVNSNTIKENEIKCIRDELKNFDISAQEELWNYVKSYKNSGLLEGYGNNKNKFFNEIFIQKLPDETPIKTCDQIELEYKQLNNEDLTSIDSNSIKKIDFNQYSEIENDAIFNEIIVGNDNSIVANLIKNLQNSDWVDKGLKYLNNTEDKCPFCQQSINKELTNEIQKYFEGNISAKKLDLNKLKSKYQTLISSIITKDNLSNIIKVIYPANHKEKSEEYDLYHKKLEDKLDNNLNKIENKISHLTHEIELSSTKEEISEINNFFIKITEEINSYNNKIKKIKESKKDLQNLFFERIRWDKKDAIEKYFRNKKTKDDYIELVNEKIEKIKNEIADKDNKIKDLNATTQNLKIAIDNINLSLKKFAIEDFKIMESVVQEGYYQLKRSNEEAKFKSLSEGEKTIITFLYFVEVCKGVMDKNDKVYKEKIIVIDDPISSLSNNYVFKMSGLISNEFIKNLGSENNRFKQVFILTHNLYFFHELCHIAYGVKKGKVNYYRITKNKYSQINKLEYEGLPKNNYEENWQIIQDGKDKNYPIRVLILAMRNILEQYCAFLKKEGLKKIIIDQTKTRHINKLLHSDRDAINDYGEIDSEIIFKDFRDIFIEDLNNEEHYNKMMDLQNQKTS